MPSIIQADQLKSADGNTTYLNSGTLSNLTFPSAPSGGGTGGHILQIASASFQGVQTITGLTDVTSLSCSMTITSGNKVLILANVSTGRGADDYGAIFITDGSNNNIYVNNQASGNQINASMAVMTVSGANDTYFVDSQSFCHEWTPGVTSVTVKVRAQCTYGTNIFINRPGNTYDYSYNVKSVSNLTIMEIQA